MFLHFDIKEDVIGAKQADDLICPQCSESGCITFCILADYVQFFCVPLLSLFNKTGFAQCDNCDKKYWRGENMPMNFKDIFEDFFKKIRYPAWHFKLLWFFLVILLISIIGNLLNNSN
jgi:uncharacterized protein with PIN domain